MKPTATLATLIIIGEEYSDTNLVSGYDNPQTIATGIIHLTKRVVDDTDIFILSLF